MCIRDSYMSIALNALSAEAAVLCEALNLPFDVAVKVMSLSLIHIYAGTGYALN